MPFRLAVPLTDMKFSLKEYNLQYESTFRVSWYISPAQYILSDVQLGVTIQQHICRTGAIHKHDMKTDGIHHFANPTRGTVNLILYYLTSRLTWFSLEVIPQVIILVTRFGG